MEKSLDHGYFLTILIFVAILFFLITCHELGHFLASGERDRRRRVRHCFPPRLFSVKKGRPSIPSTSYQWGPSSGPPGKMTPQWREAWRARAPGPGWASMPPDLWSHRAGFVFISAFFME